MKKNRSSRFGVSLSHATLALGALCLPACGGSEDSDPVAGGGTGGTGPAMRPDVGTMLASPTTCTEPNTICMNMEIPSTMQGQPTRLVFNLYPSPEPPASLPAGFAGYFTAPAVTPGEHKYFKLSDAGLQGDYWVWVIAYMEGGGYGAPVDGIDYGMASAPAAVHLDGTPINVAAPVVLEPN